MSGFGLVVTPRLVACVTPLLVVPHSDGTIQYDDFIELVYGSTTAAEEEASVWRGAQVREAVM